uniref:Uncharacterized protein n=1 Tax=Ciona intestinalis TaxID=7719 RepID=H2XM00_CIOIN
MFNGYVITWNAQHSPGMTLDCITARGVLVL